MDLIAFDSVIKLVSLSEIISTESSKRRILNSSMCLVRMLMFKWAILKPRLEGIKSEILLC